MTEPKNKKTLKERIDEANKKHNFKYDYSLIDECPIYNNENIFSSVEKCIEKAISSSK